MDCYLLQTKPPEYDPSLHLFRLNKRYPVSEMLWHEISRTVDNVQNTSEVYCNIPPSEPFKVGR